MKRFIHPCAQLHETHLQLLQNLVLTISNKYFALDRRIELLICKSLRTRISLWLLEQAEAAGSDTFAVPLTRAGLAEYLNCDRSALEPGTRPDAARRAGRNLPRQLQNSG